jgi:flagellar protein FlaG
MIGNSSTVTAAPARTAAPLGNQTVTQTAKDGAAGGKPLPAGGTPLPAAAPPPGPQIDPVDIHEAVDRLNRLAEEAGRDLSFSVDQHSGRTVITVRRALTDEVVRQIPSEEVLQLARSLDSGGVDLLGSLVNDEA